MKALIDGDIIRYEVGFAAEAGWRHLTERDELPPWEFVRNILDERLAYILREAKADEACIYITEGPTFREDIAVSKPYKGTRQDKKPYHFRNLTVALRDVEGAQVVTKIEADDQMALDALKAEGQAIICSRDKDLRQVPVPVFSWELGKQPSFGPEVVTEPGYLTYEPGRNKLLGTGFAFFSAQMLMGDVVDNIPGLPGMGAKGAHKLLEHLTSKEEYIAAVEDAYQAKCDDDWEDYMVEQGRLLWITRRLHPDGSPVLWERGMTE